MPLILNIDTAVQSASVCLADGLNIFGALVNPSERDSGAWLHTAIHDLLRQCKIELLQVKAIAISAGPGSYTGLRVGMATAKGLCYALSVPLITVPTLQMMAASVQSSPNQLLCPMIDARRMEVFTALYNSQLDEITPATNIILEEGYFDKWLDRHSLLFFGNGSGKAQSVIMHRNAQFTTTIATAVHMVSLSAERFARHQFADLAYAEPLYAKEFHSPISKAN